MVKVSVQVRKGASRFTVAVRAESFQRAMTLVRGRYPTSEYRVNVPHLALNPNSVKSAQRPVAIAA